MSVSPDTPPGDLETKLEPIVFSSAHPIVSISAEFNPGGGTGPRETVYDGTDATHGNGSFAYLYRLSTHVGNDWTIVRENGWPAPFALAIKEVVAAGPPRAATLQPTLYSPLVQWALQGAPSPARMYIDRSGNNRHLTAGPATPVPDLIPGQTAVTAADLQATLAALALSGAMTLTARVKPSGTTHQAFVDVGDTGTTSNYYLARGVTGTLQYATAYAMGIDSGIAMPAGEWCFISLRRASPTEVTLGVGATYATSIGVTPGVGSSGRVILGTVEGVSAQWAGALADLCIWGHRLTDGELDVLRAAAMGAA